MPAAIADIAAGTRDVVTASWTDAAIAARYPSARDGSLSPSDGYFDAIADAQAVINARGNLIGVDRRRFAVAIGELLWPDLSTGLPQCALRDVEQAASINTFCARIELDLQAETTTDELFG